MVIEPLENTASSVLEGHTRKSCRVIYEKGNAEAETVWFDIPAQFASDDDVSGDAWLTCFLPLAFALGERFVIESCVDPLLLWNAYELQRVWSSWRPHLKPVDIECRALNGGSGTRPPRSASFFSGGVDSFFTILHQQHTAGRNQAGERPIDDVIFAWGFDFKLDKLDQLKQLTDSLSTAAKSLSRPLHLVASNLRQTRFGTLPWGQVGHGPALGAVAHQLCAFSTVFISSTYRYCDSFEWGSHPLTDPLMSSGTVQIRHYGCGFSRFGKTEFISETPFALAHLQVCFNAEAGGNCGRCEKCYRTMVTLDVLDQLDQCPTLPGHLLSLERGRRILFATEGTKWYYRDIAKNAAARNRLDIVAIVAECERWNRNLKTMEQLNSRWAGVPVVKGLLLALAARLRRGAVE